MLYENHCTACHTSLAHVRENHKADSLDDLRGWVARWQTQLDLPWTVEELVSERVEVEEGWFSKTEREVFRLDPFAAEGVETGATRTTRSLIVPQRVFQVLAEKDPEGFRALRKFVVGKEGRVLVYG